MKKTLVVCDVCDTLFDSNTTFDFIKFILRRDNGFRFFILQNISSKYSPLFYLMTFLGKVVGADMIRSIGILLLKNKSEDQLSDLANQFFDEYLASRKNQLVFRLLEQQEGKVILLSSSISPIIKVIASHYGFDFVCSELDFKSSITSGKLRTDLTGKKHIVLRKLMDDNNINNLVAISDNHSDYEMIKMANHRYVVIKSETDKSFWKSLSPQFLLVK
jgi:phosphoserine phosphatase